MIQSLMKMLLQFVFYNAFMNKNQIYMFFIDDIKNKNSCEFTQEFYKKLKDEQNRFILDIVDSDIQNFRQIGNNNSVRMGFKYNRSDSDVKYWRNKVKERLRESLYQYYITNKSIQSLNFD